MADSKVTSTSNHHQPPPLILKQIHRNMLGLHNIFLVAPPSSSFQQPDQNQHHIVGQCNASSSNSQVWTNQKTSFSREDAIIDLEGNEDSYITSRVCKDCGNRAKKECEYRRCRTCCRSRGLACATHVKSTWVPAARRRERQSDVGGDRDLSTGSSSGGKRPREYVAANSNSFSTSNNSSLHQVFDGIELIPCLLCSVKTLSLSFDYLSDSSHTKSSCFLDSESIDASFKQALPGQVRAPAVFRSVRVTAMNDGEVEIAYQAMVKISGHVFKGFLYDQGIAENDEVPCISPTVSSILASVLRCLQALINLEVFLSSYRSSSINRTHTDPSPGFHNQQQPDPPAQEPITDMEEYSLLCTVLRNGCIIVWCVVAAVVMMFGAVLELKTFLQEWHKDGYSKTRALSNLFLYIGFVFFFNIFWISAVIQCILTWKMVTATSPKITPIDDRVELYFAAQPQNPQP